MITDAWLRWARELQSIAQIGLVYENDPYGKERYQRVREISIEIIARHSDLDASVVREAFEQQKGYLSPKVDVRAACFRSDRVLLVREVSDGKWALPGGFADVNMSASECAVREVREESGFEVRATKLASVLDREKHPHQPPFLFHIYKLFFICEITGGSPSLSHETSEVDFFPLDALPPLSLSRTLPAQIHHMHTHWKNPALPTDFD